MRVFRSSAFWRGFRAGGPLWVAALPFALAYVVAGREAGLSPLQTQFMSLSVYAAAAQIVLTQLLVDNAPTLTILVTVLMMNIHHALYGFSLIIHRQLNRLEKIVIAFPLTDFAYGVTVTQPNSSRLAFLMGAEISVFLAWNIYTAAAIWFTPFFENLGRFPLDFIIPLTFFVLLIAAIETRLEIAVAVFSIISAVIVHSLGLGGTAIIFVTLLGASFGVSLTKWRIFA